MNLLIILKMMEKQLKQVKSNNLLMFFLSRGCYLLLLLLIIFLLSTCGISTFIYIYPPNPNGTNLSFSHDSRNNKDPDFLTLGYDIYYRIYDNSSTSKFYNKTAIEVENLLIADGNTYFSSDNVNKLIFRTFADDSAYKPIKHFANDKSLIYSAPPILPIDNSESSDESFSVNIIFSQGNRDNPYLVTELPYSSSTLPENIEFRRYLPDDNDFTVFENSDDDITFSIIDNNFLVAFFVISYGFTVDFYSLTSEKPIFIGSATILGD